MIDLPTWRSRICAPISGPAKYTDRLILLVLAHLMEKEVPLRLTHEQICAATGLSRTWISQGITRLHKAGWLTRTRARPGRAWRASFYGPAVPGACADQGYVSREIAARRAVA